MRTCDLARSTEKVSPEYVVGPLHSMHDTELWPCASIRFFSLRGVRLQVEVVVSEELKQLLERPRSQRAPRG